MNQSAQNMSEIARNVLIKRAVCYMMLVTDRIDSWQPSASAQTAAQLAAASFL